ncbi:TadE/TadG family type IV pilus assembly protein [Streptomyces sp. NPDC012888]|uniref:TadE/TadG family type IV pilus assembly protein n=1 Tax=Streptomyces sp. NPDC012888 TaxID=3364855 RepID=UPI0036A6C069
MARAERDRGQASFEFLGVLPFILLLVAAVWECALIGYGFALAGNAADEAARAGAVTRSAGACEAAAREHVTAAWKPSPSCPAPPARGLYQVSVSLEVPAFFPGFNTALTISGEAAAPMEEELP